MRIAVYPGSFDPITIGHLDIIRRASTCFDKVYVCVLANIEKSQPMLSKEERLHLIQISVSDIPNVEAELFNGLLVDYAKSKNACAIVKGVRTVSDIDNEMQMSRINKELAPDLETLLVPGSAQYGHISSTMVRDMIRYHQPIDRYVPAPVAAELKERI